jgi:hypothetical protein
MKTIGVAVKVANCGFRGTPVARNCHKCSTLTLPRAFQCGRGPVHNAVDCGQRCSSAPAVVSEVAIGIGADRAIEVDDRGIDLSSFERTFRG